MRIRTCTQIQGSALIERRMPYVVLLFFWLYLLFIHSHIYAKIVSFFRLIDRSYLSSTDIMKIILKQHIRWTNKWIVVLRIKLQICLIIIFVDKQMNNIEKIEFNQHSRSHCFICKKTHEKRVSSYTKNRTSTLFLSKTFLRKIRMVTK